MAKSFRGRSLRGVSFQGQNLTAADFREADIRGANFAQATLVGADFSHTVSGQQRPWLVVIVALAVLLALVAGLLAAYASGWVGALLMVPTRVNRFDRTDLFLLSSLFSLTVLAVAAWVMVRRGTGTTFSVLATVFVLTVTFTLWLGEGEGQGEALAVLILQFLALGTILASVAVAALAVAIAVSIDRRWVLPLLAAAVCVAGVAGATESVRGIELTPSKQLAALVLAGAITAAVMGLSVYIGCRAMKTASRYHFIRSLGTRLSSLGGTSFRQADLTDASFSGASLRRADLRDATIQRVRWYQAQNLHQARLGHTYLANPHIRALVTTGQGAAQHYDRLSLRGLNLQGAQLQNASLIGADLSESSLKGADLSGAKLAQTQLYSCDLRKACLTGAYIENWGISTDTRLGQVRCDFVYMRLPTSTDPDPCRKPDSRNEIFKPGDFEDFIAPIIKTLDLYRQQNIDLRTVATTYKTIDLFHHEGIDASAAALALQQLALQHPEAGLEVIALEGRGQQKIRLQARVSSQANRSELSDKYFDNYDQLLNLPYADLQSLLAGVVEKDEQIRKLESLLDKAIQQPRFYVETYHNQGEFIMSQSKGNIQVGDVQGNVSGLAAAGEGQTLTGVTLGEVSGSVTNTINQLPDTAAPGQPSLKHLLGELQTAIETEPALAEEDKIEALSQVEVLAEAGQEPEDSALQRAAKTALKILRGTAAGLSETSQLVESCSTLLPAIAALLVLL